MSNFSDKVAFIWSVADLLRGPYKPHQYGRVILPLTMLRRLDCVLEPTKAKVLEKHAVLTLVNMYWLPTINAVVALKQKLPKTALASSGTSPGFCDGALVASSRRSNSHAVAATVRRGGLSTDKIYFGSFTCEIQASGFSFWAAAIAA